MLKYINMKYSIEHLGKKFKEARKKMGLSQRALGTKVGLPQSHISRIENGEVDLQASNLIEIARSLDLELMLIPRNLVMTVEALQQSKKGKPSEPMYQLDNEEEDYD